jgi:hypothetical protein
MCRKQSDTDANEDEDYDKIAVVSSYTYLKVQQKLCDEGTKLVLVYCNNNDKVTFLFAAILNGLC